MSTVLALLLALVLAPAAHAADPAASGSRAGVPASSAWKRYVIDPGEFVYPKAVYEIGTPGSVQNPGGLKGPGGGTTTIVSPGLRPDGVGDPALILDLGVNVGGFVELGLTASDGTPIRLGYAELFDYITPRGDTEVPGFSFGVSDEPESRSDAFQATSAVQFRSPGIRGAQRFIAIQLEGPGTATIDYVRVRTGHLRAGPRQYSGYFLSSDRLLNQIWYASAYTFAIDSFRDLRPGYEFTREVVSDGAKRDRMIWAGDMGLQTLVGSYSLRAARDILRRSLHAFSCLQFSDGQLAPATQIAVQCPPNPPPPVGDASQFPPTAQPAAGNGALRLPQYTAAWIVALRDYYLFTGERRFAHSLMPVVRRGLAHFLGGLDGGLYRTPFRDMTINWHPPDIAGGIDAHTNASVYRALLAAALLERRVGMGRRSANTWLQRAAALRSAMIGRLWDPQAGAFIGNADNPAGNHTQDAQVEAILAGITGATQSRQALAFIDTHLMTQFGAATGQFDDDPYMSRYISPFASSTELLARLSVRDTNGAINSMRRTWGQMLARGPGTVWESMRLDGIPKSGGISLAHGWGGGPVPALSGYVLGIRPTAPGYRHWIIAPQPGTLRFAQGQAPTPRGAIASRWRRAGRTFKLTIEAPRRTKGVVELPLLRRPGVIAMDGRVIWRRGRRVGHLKRHGDVVRVKKVTPGEHTFLVR